MNFKMAAAIYCNLLRTCKNTSKLYFMLVYNYVCVLKKYFFLNSIIIAVVKLCVIK